MAHEEKLAIKPDVATQSSVYLCFIKLCDGGEVHHRHHKRPAIGPFPQMLQSNSHIKKNKFLNYPSICA
jgi:hypothetical protein